MKKCPGCGSIYEDTQKFCSECGSPLVEVTEEVPAVPAEPEKVEEPAAPAEPVEVIEPVEPEKLEAPDEPEEPKKPEKPEKPKKEKKPREKKKVGAGRRVLAVLLCLLLFLFLLTPALGFMVRRATTEEGLKAVMEDVDLADMQAAPFFDDVEEEISFSEMISEDLGRDGLKIGESSVGKILNSSALKSFLASQAAQVFADVYAGRTRFEFDPDDLRTELTEGKTSRVLEKEKLDFDSEEIDKIVNLLQRYGLGDFLSRDTLKDEYPVPVSVMNICLSWIMIIGLLVLAVLLIVLIFMANRGSIGLSLGDIGGTTIAVGALLTLASLFARLISGVWQKICGNELLAAGSAGVLFYSIRISLIVLGAGVVLAVVGRLFRGKKKEKPGEEIE